MVVMDYKWRRRRPFPAISSSWIILILCLDYRRDATVTAQEESDAAKKCDEIKIGELIV